MHPYNPFVYPEHCGQFTVCITHANKLFRPFDSVRPFCFCFCLGLVTTFKTIFHCYSSFVSTGDLSLDFQSIELGNRGWTTCFHAYKVQTDIFKWNKNKMTSLIEFYCNNNDVNDPDIVRNVQPNEAQKICDRKL